MDDRADLIAGAVLVDNLIYADGTQRENIPGGAGLYALAGAALFSGNAVLVTGTGRDLPHTFGPWMAANGLSQRGLRLGDDHTPRNILRYLDDRSRTETPVYGLEHFSRLEPSVEDARKRLSEARSLYVFRNTDQAFWDGLLSLCRDSHRPKILWEIALDACTPGHVERIRTIAQAVDALSINVEEARNIFGVLPEDQLIEKLIALGASTLFLRAGAHGSFVATPDAVHFVPSMLIAPVDVTGGGNAYSGAALVGIAQGRPPLVCAAMGTVAASRAISQHGPPPCGSAVSRESAYGDLTTILCSLEITA